MRPTTPAGRAAIVRSSSGRPTRKRSRRSSRSSAASVGTFFESGNGAINWRYLPASNEIIWFSERDNWGQLYLYDLQTGKLKHQITTGDGNVTQVLRVDGKTRTVFFLGVGHEKGRDP